MKRLFEPDDMEYAALLAHSLKGGALRPPGYDGVPVEVRAELFFEGDPLGIAVRLDGTGENYLVEVSSE